MAYDVDFDCDHCSSKNHLKGIEEEFIGKEIKVKCHKCKKINKVHLEPPEIQETTGLFELAWYGFVVLFVVLMFLPSFDIFSSCESRGYFSRPFCVTSSIYNGFTEDSSSNQNLQNTKIKPPSVNYYPNYQQPKPVATDNIRPSLTTEQIDEINAQIVLVKDRYDYCVAYTKEKSQLVSIIRDQGTLYQYDDGVTKCVSEYINQAKTLSDLVWENREKISQADGENIKNSLLSQANYLISLSQSYLSSSEQRHYYIHGVYQTQQLISLYNLIGETTGRVSEGDAIGTINSLQSLYEWWYYNGGVIDTGWGL